MGEGLYGFSATNIYKNKGISSIPNWQETDPWAIYKARNMGLLVCFVFVSVFVFSFFNLMLPFSLDGMPVDHKVTFQHYNHRYPFIHLGEERQGKLKLLCLGKQHDDGDQAQTNDFQVGGPTS